MAEIISLDDLLEDVDDFQDDFEESRPALEFPCIVVKGITFEQEALNMRDRFEQGEDKLPLYFQIGEDPPVLVGDYALNIKNIQLMVLMGYEGTLWTPDGRQVDLLAPENVYNFMRL